MSLFTDRFLAVDWGTTNRRVYLIEGGRVVRDERDARGVTSVAAGGFANEAAAIRARFGDLPMLMAGMVGSTIGWREAAYVPAPAGLDAVAAAVLRLDERTAIVPGVSWTEAKRGDVMRGEEVQLLGAVASGSVPQDALVCHPGTHAKWAELAGGRIASFTTAMTGELWALLRGHGVLAPQLAGAVEPGDAFLAGVEEGRRRDLAGSLFGVRAARLLGLRADADAPSFASGLLIGAEVAARLADHRRDTVHLIGDPALTRLYAAAIEAHGRAAPQLDGETAFTSGMIAIGARL